MKSMILAALAFLITATGASANTKFITIDVMDFNAVPFEGVVIYGGHEYPFSDRDAVRVKGYDVMIVRRVSMPIDWAAVEAAAESPYAFEIRLSADTGFSKEHLVPASSVRRGTHFTFDPEGWKQ